MKTDEKAKDLHIITLISGANRANLKTPPRLTLKKTFCKYYDKEQQTTQRISLIMRIKKQPTGYFKVNIQSGACSEDLHQARYCISLHLYGLLFKFLCSKFLHPPDTEPDGGFHNVVSSRLKADRDLGD